MDRDLERAQLSDEATHRNGTRVAVKVLHTEVAAIPDIKKRFQREGYIASSSASSRARR